MDSFEKRFPVWLVWVDWEQLERNGRHASILGRWFEEKEGHSITLTHFSVCVSVYGCMGAWVYGCMGAWASLLPSCITLYMYMYMYMSKSRTTTP